MPPPNVVRVPDEQFVNPRLAAVYDAIDGDRSDLELYAALVDEFAASSVLDVGCGTGTLACLLATRGLDVLGVDPAAASLDMARNKPSAHRVRWLLGDATTLPALTVDLVTMTGNVAQVFLRDEEWLATLSGLHDVLGPSGRLAFEVRDPARRAWEHWHRDQSWSRVDVPGAGLVESWIDLTNVSLPFVSFRSSYRFEVDDVTLTSNSTLRFRTRAEVEASLSDTGFDVLDVRDAPDRPGNEFVFIAGRTDAGTSATADTNANTEHSIT